MKGCYIRDYFGSSTGILKGVLGLQTLAHVKQAGAWGIGVFLVDPCKLFFGCMEFRVQG